MSKEDIVIVAAARTAVGKFGGTLAKVPASDLGATVLKELLARAKLEGGQIGEVILGQVLDRRRGSEPGAPGADQGRPAEGAAGDDDQRRLRLRAEGGDVGGAGHPRR